MSTEHPGAERPGAEQPRPEQPQVEHPPADQPGTERSTTERRGTDRPRTGRPVRLAGLLGRRAGLTRGVGVGALVATQTADVATTVVALRYVPGLEEANAVAAAAVAAFGPLVGLTAAGLVAVGFTVLVTELGASILRGDLEEPDRAVAAVRLVGYGPLTVLNVAVVVHNALLIATACCPA